MKSIANANTLLVFVTRKFGGGEFNNHKAEIFNKVKICY